ncbi:MAG: hypothetical protein JWQ04_1490 [Pedosphaera sp.]|nr:hypothetical protein [Pedosphaera sp.]
MPEVAVKSPRIVVPETPRWHQRLAALIIHVLLRLVSATLRYRFTDRSGLREGNLQCPAIYCIWHNRLALSMASYFRYIKKYNKSSGLAAMASASRDGGMLIAVLQYSGVQPVRGSTSRRGPQALRELTTWAKRGYDLAITPDGPRGPRCVVQEGVVALAQLTGLPLVAVSFNLGWKITVKSWDRFQIPLPFSRCEMIFEKPLRVPRETSETGRETFRLELEQAMKNITKD